jgi:hypothetical protein
MPTSLQILLRSRATALEEENLERGRIWVYSPGTMYTPFCSGFCWTSPGPGTAVIEVWGAGGSSAQMCCCGAGVPGNAGAYVKKTISVTTGCVIRGSVGLACGNSSTLCFRGCSDPTGVCYFGTAGSGCLCARGGKGGVSYCSTSTSPYCCFAGNGFCATGPFNANCGIICNQCSGAWEALGYGGDVNCCGMFSCARFYGCESYCPCCQQYSIAIPPGLFSCCGTVAVHGTEDDSRSGLGSGAAIHKFFPSIAGLNRTSVKGVPMSYCWRSDRACGCYEMQGCMPYLPPGVGGMAVQPCPGVRDHGIRGGMGAVRIRFFT